MNEAAKRMKVTAKRTYTATNGSKRIKAMPGRDDVTGHGGEQSFL